MATDKQGGGCSEDVGQITCTFLQWGSRNGSVLWKIIYSYCVTLQFSTDAKGMKNNIYPNIGTHVHIAARSGNTEESIHGSLTTGVRPYGWFSTQPSKKKNMNWPAAPCIPAVSAPGKPKQRQQDDNCTGRKTPPQKQARQTGRANWPGNSSKVTTVPLCSCFCEEPAFVSLVCIPHPITSLLSESALTTSSQCSLSVPTPPSAQLSP